MRTPALPRPARPGSDFTRLSELIAAEGLLRRRHGYYAVRIAIVIGLFVAGWAAVVALGDTWWQLVVAVALALIFGQVAFVAHDIAHRQVFRSRRYSGIAGRLLGNLGIGMSYGWWMDKHTRHHANPNHEQLDPDVSPEILVWSTDQARASRGVARFVGGWQAFLFFPLLTLEGINLHVASIRALRRPQLRHRWLEGSALVAHVAAYAGGLLLVMSPAKALVFVAVHQGLFGVYLGCAFAPNHKGMPTLAGDERRDFLRKQVLTSRNVRGGWFVDTALGGLNYQIEHHLFPSMPSPNLRRAAPIVRDYCRRMGVPYEETGLLASYTIALRHLHRAGAPLRPPARRRRDRARP